MFRCENISKCYKNIPVIKDINIELPDGLFISLVGPSGVGKTTLFNVLSGVDKPDSGAVFLDDADISGIPGKVSYMLQKDMLLPFRSVLDNVILPLLIKGEQKHKAREYGGAFFKQFGLAGYEKKYPHQISGGERQRAALLRTCMMHHKVILLDEPFSALDYITRLSLSDWYVQIAHEMNFSTLFITHDIDESIRLSRRVYVMNNTPGIISKIIDIPNDVHKNPKLCAELKNAILKEIA